MNNQLFYSEIILIAIGAYFELVISGYLNLKEPINSTNGERYAYFLGLFSTILAVIALPFAFANMLM